MPDDGASGREPACSLLQQGISRSIGPSEDILLDRANPLGSTRSVLDKSITSSTIWANLHFKLQQVPTTGVFNLFAPEDVAGHRHLIHLAALMLTCGLVGALVVWAARRPGAERHFAAYLAALRAFKLAFKVGLSSCIIAAIGGSLMPLGQFHIVSAGVTALIVMEMGSVDRLLVKGFLRAMGTLIGAAESVVAIKVIEYGQNLPAVVFASIFMVTVTNAMLQLFAGRQGYMCLASNITFVFVFYGYFIEGVQALTTRITSVFIAVGVAWLVDVLWPLVWLDSAWFSVNNVVSGTQKVLRKTFAIVDFTFVHDEILAQDGSPETLASTLWKDRLFQTETIDFFRMKQENLKLGDLQAQLSKHAHGKLIANEADIAMLHQEAKNAWEDIQFTYWLIRRRPPHNYYLLFERLHATYAQACSLSHMAYSSLSTSGKALWHSNRDCIETLRKALYSLEAPLLRLCNLCDGGQPAAVDALVMEIADALEHVVRTAEDALQGVQTCCKQDRWRFEAFIMTVELFAAELSTYVRKLLENFGTCGQAQAPAIDTFQSEESRSYIRDDDSHIDHLITRLTRLSWHADM